MVLSKQLEELSQLQNFDNKMDSLYKEGLPSDAPGRRLGPKQKQFLEKRNHIVCKLDDRLVRKYERLRDSRIRGNAVVPVVNGVCHGCFLTVTKAMIAQLLEGASLITCEHCGRILYIDHE